MCEIYEVGPDDLGWDIEHYIKGDRYVWFVYHYEQDSCEGRGEAVALRKDGLLDCCDLGHCSCYGPLESWGTGRPMTIEEYLEPKESIHDYEPGEVVDAKVRELLGLS